MLKESEPGSSKRSGAAFLIFYGLAREGIETGTVVCYCQFSEEVVAP